MRPYGLTRQKAGDLDVAGCCETGRKTQSHNIPGRGGGDTREYRSLRKGKRYTRRRAAKRLARRQGREEIAADISQDFDK